MCQRPAKSIVCLAVTPCLQRTLQFDGLTTGAVNRARSVTISLGGKSVNVARALKALDRRALLVGLAGGATGEALLSMLAALNIETEFVATAKATRICTTLIDRSTGSVTELVEEAPSPAEEEWTALEGKLSRMLPHDSLLVASGALPPGSPEDRYARLAEIAAERAAGLVLDSRGRALLNALRYRPVLAKLNRAELEEMYPHGTKTQEALIGRGRLLAAEGAQWVLITAGADKAWLTDKDRAWAFTPPPIRALNAVGSGDAATAGIAHRLAAGESMPDAIRFGMACGAANALTLTPGDVDAATVKALLAQVRVKSLAH